LKNNIDKECSVYLKSYLENHKENLKDKGITAGLLRSINQVWTLCKFQLFKRDVLYGIPRIDVISNYYVPFEQLALPDC